ncbi:28S ribosomal protein S30, mitochondrial [Orussus abietinus]|uniref:28S ribosomal protein S30, mitochondrial n=1 Tax=Orussus abietinus TaxID=222816 RepID=UPI000626BB96|nr:28S ribosomal protein S30, mitochondrial [Orussus abietinus]
MSLSRINKRFCARVLPVVGHTARKYISPAVEEIQSSKVPEYPPILDVSYLAQKQRQREQAANEVKVIKTVEEKLFKLNIPRYYGWNTLNLEEGKICYNSLPFAQYITRTHVKSDSDLPSCYNDSIESDVLNVLVDGIKDKIKNAILFEYTERRRESELDKDVLLSPSKLDDVMADAVVRQINRLILGTLSTKYPHLLEVQVDYEPRIEAFWKVGGIVPTKGSRSAKINNEFLKEYADMPIDRWFQYNGNPLLQLRHEFPLKEIIPLSDSENTDLNVPEFRYDPRVLGYSNKLQHGTCIPGFWPGDPSEFGTLSYHKRGYMAERPATYDDKDDTLIAQSILASYGWLYPQACYQGFSTFQDVTYPLVTQTIISNGQWWTFCVYQLNTTLLYSEHIDINPRRNICWATKPMKLFEKVEEKQLHGFNEEVLKLLIKFYANVPIERAINMKPYLGETEKVIADIEDPERREWLEHNYKYLVSKRSRHRLMPEIYNWEWIYKINHKTRPLDRRDTKWELGKPIINRRLDDHTPQYIPKALRPEGPKSKNKWAKTYYP